MSYKTRLVKIAIKWTPKPLVLLGANIVLKGIAKLTDFSLDLDMRRAYVQTRLYGESENIEVLLEGFAVVGNKGSYQFILQKGLSNRLWLNNLLARIAGKPWAIPAIPQLAPYMEFLAELLKAEMPALVRLG